jgi:2-methylcitrate dehydratase
MATVIERIGQYVAELKYEDLDQKVVDYTKRILLDTLACGYGGLDNEPSRMVRKTVDDLEGGGQATIFGKGKKTSAQLAALANGVAIRYQDYNDVYIGSGWTGHPSDCISTLLAVAEWKKLSGRDLIRAIVAAYEVHMRFSDLDVPKLLWHRGWHHSAMCSYTAAAGLSTMLGLNAERTGHALALSGARSNTFAQIRHGDIPMDKALSAPIVATQSIIYTLLAQQGFTGSNTLLEGKFGFRYAVAGGVDVESLVPKRGEFRILKTALKPYPIEGMTPAMVESAIKIKKEYNVQPDEIESIRILSFEETLIKPSWDDTKLAPTTKETADHSFYYCVAVALLAGECTSAQFTDEWLRNPAVGKMMAKMKLEEKPELTTVFRKENARPGAVEVKTKRGVFYREVLYCFGDPRNPMQWDDVGEKFTNQANPVLGAAAAKEVIAMARDVDNLKDIGSLTGVLGGHPA